MEPILFIPFSNEENEELRQHVLQVRKIFDVPGNKYHDCDAPEKDKFNRWCWHNLPLLVKFHHSPEFLMNVRNIFKKDLKPSYVFLSMYGPEGVCPLHTDRPQCQYTVDMVISQDGLWPIYIDNKPFGLQTSQAICYSGTEQPHYRKPMNQDSEATYCNLAFFHFVETNWMGPLS